ncbi:MAG: FtsW/RodA/SpoVE family cell cycle protein, partial [Verrucomicrobiae bacterium]|nr:FtsW/RodA/SpoVE family cell cycle protein [Verrucomicrobiae bacterium]
MNERKSGLRNAALMLLGCTLALTVFGLVMLYEVASPGRAAASVVSRQVVALILGAAGAGLVLWADYGWIRRLAWPLYSLAVGLLAYALVWGRVVNGARRWIYVAGVGFQPSDFAKVALLMALAAYCSSAGSRITSFKDGILKPALIVGLVTLLIFVEPDWGTALILGLAAAVMLLVAGIRLRYALIPSVLLTIAVGTALCYNGLRMERIDSWLDLESTRRVVGYQAWQARLAFASGGPVGLGFSASTQRAFVPECQTDFIFAIIGEEFGFLGSLLLLGAFAMILHAGLRIAREAPDRFGALLVTGISFLLAGQALCNMAVVSGALPNKGLTLPFVSQGGSNLMMMLVSVGVL